MKRKLTTDECGHLRYILQKVASRTQCAGLIDIVPIDWAMVKLAEALDLEMPDTDYAYTLMQEENKADWERVNFKMTV